MFRVSNLPINFELPLGVSKIECGFPSPAEDYLEELDLISHLVPNPVATYLFRITGGSMAGAGIFEDDVAIVDRSVSPRPGHTVIAIVDGQFTCKRLEIANGVLSLVQQKMNCDTSKIAKAAEIELWGVVTSTITSHTYKSR